MTSKAKNLSVLIDKQLPSFIASEYPLFSEFLQKYYEHLELSGHPIDLINNLTKYRDVDTYDSSILNEYTTLQSIQEIRDNNNNITSVIITVEDGSSFPDKNGYILIDDEIIFYKSKEGSNTFIDCYRNVSYTTTLGDLYTPSEFKSVPYEEVGVGSFGQTSGIFHAPNSIVKNVSNLFLYALVKNFEKEYLSSFPENAVKRNVNKSFLIKNIKTFYATKGTDQSIRFIFNSIVSKDPSDIPTVYYPRDSVYKASTGDWINKYALKVKVLSGDITKIVGEKIIQNKSSSKKYAFAIVDNIQDIGDGFHELILAPESIVGTFDILSQAKLTKDLLPNDKYINVSSTLGWKDEAGSIVIGNEVINYNSKTIRQFKIDSREQNSSTYYSGDTISEYSTVSSFYVDSNGIQQEVKIFVLGVVYGILPNTVFPHSKPGDPVQISPSGVETKNTIIFDSLNNRIRWILNQNNASPVSSNTAIQNNLDQILNNVSAIFEDEEYFYITSSGYPDYSFGKNSWNQILQDQKNLKLIRKSPSKTTEIYETNSSDVAIFVNGVTARSCKDIDDNLVVYGEITDITVTSQGSNYKKPPFVLVQDGNQNIVATAKAIMNGEVVEKIEVIDSGSGFFPPVPVVTITSGRNAVVEAVVTKDKVTNLKIINPGEYYSSPPNVVIKDTKGSGRFASYDSIIDEDGRLVGFKKNNEGKFYTQENIVVEIQPVGSGATASSIVRSWRKDLLNQYKSSLDDNYGYYFENADNTLGYGYSCLANPKSLRVSLSDNLNALGVVPAQLSHSPILGYAYDGNPIYGPYGYSNPVDTTSSISRMTSSYVLNSDRLLGPPLSQYPLGSFIEDYSYSHRSGHLDENNGRFCVTPDYPEGTYAYFITIDSNNNPVFPYILGKNYYSIPVDSNYKKAISQKDLPVNVKVIRNDDIFENGENLFARIISTSNGNVNSAIVEESSDIFSVGSVIESDYTNTSGNGISAKVSSIKGKEVTSIESKSSIKIVSENNAYFFNGDIITQESTNASGEVVGDVFDSKTIILRNISGSFNTTNTLFSTTKVVNLLLDKSSSYTSSSEIVLTNGKQQAITRIISNVLSVGINPFVDGELISFSSSAHGLIAGNLYYVIGSTSTTFLVSETLNGSPVTLTDTNLPGIVAVSEAARGIILETSNLSNTVKIKITKGDFIVDSDYYLRSLTISDTIGSKIVINTSLSSGIKPFTKNENISIVTTSEDHQLAIGDKVNISIDPSDIITESTYYVRSRIYQKVSLETPLNTKIINDTGIGDIVVLNNGSYYDNTGSIVGDYAYTTSGNNTFQNVELVFSDISKCRDSSGKIVGDSSTAEIGKPGNSNNAKATISVTSGIVTNITITEKGKGYKKGDILTVSPSNLDRYTQSSNTRFLTIEVNHVGFGFSQTKLYLNDVNNIAQNDYFTIGNEIVKVSSINQSNSYVEVLRQQFETVAENHFDNQEINSYKPTYNFPVNYRLGNSDGDATILSYNREKQEIVVVYDLGINIDGINSLNSGNSFFDDSFPQKIVRIKDNIEAPIAKFEFSTSSNDLSNTWQRNPILKLQKYYKYKFDTSHYTLRGSHLDFSPSKNYNIITTESVKNDILPGNSGSQIVLKFGYGDAIASNNYSSRKTLYYNQYFYFDKNNLIDSDNNFINLVNDPLQKENTVTYVTPNRFVYEMTEIPAYNGSGSMSYTTTSATSIGSINGISIINGGSNFDTIPSILGALPAKEFECIVDANWDPSTRSLVSASIINSGKGYIKPQAVVISETGSGSKFDLSIDENGSISGIIIKNKGSGYKQKPTIRIIETYIKAYYQSINIGLPKTIEIISNGKNYNSDYSTSKQYSGCTILEIKDLRNIFISGEVVEQYENGNITAKAKVAQNGWSNNTNIIRLIDVVGKFKENLPILGTSRNGSAIVVKSFVATFKEDIRSYYDNLGYYASDKGKLSSNYQKLADNYFYQDYSYVIKSKTPVDKWREVITDTVHPAGFKLFGDITLESNGSAKLKSQQPSIVNISNIQLWDSSKNRVTVQSSSRKITTSTLSLASHSINRGKGFLTTTSYDTGETISYDFRLVPEFNGYFDDNGNRSGTKTFTITLISNNSPYSVPKSENIILSLDGVIQEPGDSFTVSGNQITFAEPPLGYRDINGNPISSSNYKEGVDTPAQKIIGKIIRFKDTSLNNSYFKKIKDISSQFDGIKTSFKLYYTDNSDVILPSKENLMVYIDGFLQKSGITPSMPIDRSYYIRRTVVPNEIVFMEAPKLGQYFGGVSVGGYERLTVKSSDITENMIEPLKLTSQYFERTISIDDDKNILVFLDGVLQRRNKNYTILNSSIIFKDYIKSDQDIEVLFLFGKDSVKSVIGFDYDNVPFLNSYNIIVNGEVTFVDQGFRAKSISSEGIVRRISYIYDTSRQISKTVITVDTQNTPFNTSENIVFTLGFTTITVLSSNIEFVVPFSQNEDTLDIVQRSRSGWLTGSTIKYNYTNILNEGDYIKIDGEDDFRKVLAIPESGIKTDYRSEDDLNSSYCAKIQVSNYNDTQRGEGLEITATIENGKVISLDWNKVDWQNAPKNPKLPGYGYEGPVLLQFVPQPLKDDSGEIISDAQGGGAKGYVVLANNGDVVDVILTEQGSGYLTPPRIYISRGYDVYRPRKSVNTYQVKLSLNPVILPSAQFRASSSINIIRPLDLNVLSVVTSFQGSLSDVKEKRSLIIQKKHKNAISSVVSSVSSGIKLSASISSYNAVYTYQKYKTINVSSQIQISTVSSYLHNTLSVGSVDAVRIGITDRYHQNVLGNRLSSFTNHIRFMNTGYSDVSRLSLEDFSLYYPNVSIDDLSNQLNTNNVNNSITPWIITYPSIQEFGAILDSSITASSTTIFIPNTSRFPSSGYLLIEGEIVKYDSKLSDRFLQVSRGQAGTTASPHAAGSYLRTTVININTSYVWSGSGNLFSLNESTVFFNDQ